MKKLNKKIFIVEDDKFYAQLIQTYLFSLGFKDVLVYHSGKDCINSLDVNPDLVILDYTLGLENGIDVLIKIKESCTNTKVIMLSGQEFLSVSIKAYKYGVIDYIEKDKNALKNLELSITRILSQQNNVKGINSIFK